MKIKRQKKVQRILEFFKNNFGHFPPYQMLLDGTFAMACLKMQINIKDQMPKYIGQEVKLLTTKCAIIETEKLGPELFGATKILKQFYGEPLEPLLFILPWVTIHFHINL